MYRNQLETNYQHGTKTPFFHEGAEWIGVGCRRTNTIHQCNYTLMGRPVLILKLQSYSNVRMFGLNLAI